MVASCVINWRIDFDNVKVPKKTLPNKSGLGRHLAALIQRVTVPGVLLGSNGLL
jgi:hypothetical protein